MGDKLKAKTNTTARDLYGPDKRIVSIKKEKAKRVALENLKKVLRLDLQSIHNFPYLISILIKSLVNKKDQTIPVKASLAYNYQSPQLADRQFTSNLGDNCTAWASMGGLIEKDNEAKTVQKILDLIEENSSQIKAPGMIKFLVPLHTKIYRELQNASTEVQDHLDHIPIDFDKGAQNVLKLLASLKEFNLQAFDIDKYKKQIATQPLSITKTDQDTKKLIGKLQVNESKFSNSFYQALIFLKILKDACNEQRESHKLDFKNFDSKIISQTQIHDLPLPMKNFVVKVCQVLNKIYPQNEQSKNKILPLARVMSTYINESAEPLEEYLNPKKYPSQLDLTTIKGPLKKALQTTLDYEKNFCHNPTEALSFLKLARSINERNPTLQEDLEKIDIENCHFSELDENIQKIIFEVIASFSKLNSGSVAWFEVLGNPNIIKSKRHIKVDSRILSMDTGKIPKIPPELIKNSKELGKKAKMFENLAKDFRQVRRSLGTREYENSMFKDYSLEESKELRQEIVEDKLKTALNNNQKQIIKLCPLIKDKLKVLNPPFEKLYKSEVEKQNLKNLIKFLSPLAHLDFSNINIDTLSEHDIKTKDLSFFDEKIQNILIYLCENDPSQRLNRQELFNIIYEIKRAKLIYSNFDDELLEIDIESPEIKIKTTVKSFFDRILEGFPKLNSQYLSDTISKLEVIELLKGLLNVGIENINNYQYPPIFLEHLQQSQAKLLKLAPEIEQINSENIFELYISNELEQELEKILAILPSLKKEPLIHGLNPAINDQNTPKLLKDQKLANFVKQFQEITGISERDCLRFAYPVSKFYNEGGSFDNIDFNNLDSSFITNSLNQEQNELIRYILRAIEDLRKGADIRGIYLDDFDKDFFTKLDFSTAIMGNNFCNLSESALIRAYIINQRVKFNYYNDIEAIDKYKLELDSLTPLAIGRLVQDAIRYKETSRKILKTNSNPNVQTIGEPVNFEENSLEGIKLDYLNDEFFNEEDFENFANSNFCDNFAYGDLNSAGWSDNLDSIESIDLRAALLLYRVSSAMKIPDNKDQQIELRDFPLDNVEIHPEISLAYVKPIAGNFLTLEKTFALRTKILIDKINAGIYDFRGIYLDDQLELLKNIAGHQEIIYDHSCFYMGKNDIESSRAVRALLLQRHFWQAFYKYNQEHQAAPIAITTTRIQNIPFDKMPNLKIECPNLPMDDLAPEYLKRAWAEILDIDQDLEEASPSNPTIGYGSGDIDMSVIKFHPSNFIRPLDESLNTRAEFLKNIYSFSKAKKIPVNLKGFILDGLNIYFASETNIEDIEHELFKLSVDSAEAIELIQSFHQQHTMIDLSQASIDSSCFADKEISKGIKEKIIHDVYDRALQPHTEILIPKNSITLPKDIFLDGLDLIDINLALLKIDKTNFKSLGKESKDIREQIVFHKYHHAILNAEIPDLRGIALDGLDLSELDLSNAIIDESNFVNLDNCIEVRENIISDRFWRSLLKSNLISPKSKYLPDKFQIYFKFADEKHWEAYTKLFSAKPGLKKEFKLFKSKLRQFSPLAYLHDTWRNANKTFTLDLKGIAVDGLAINKLCLPNSVLPSSLLNTLKIDNKNLNIKFDNSNFKDYQHSVTFRRKLTKLLWEQGKFEDIEKLNISDLVDLDESILKAIIEYKIKKGYKDDAKIKEITNSFKTILSDIASFDSTYISALLKDTARDPYQNRDFNIAIKIVNELRERVQSQGFKNIKTPANIGSLIFNLEKIYKNIPSRKETVSDNILESLSLLTKYQIEETLKVYLKEYLEQNLEIDFSKIPIREEFYINPNYLINGKFGVSLFPLITKNQKLREKIILSKLEAGVFDIRGIPLAGIDLKSKPFDKFRDNLKKLKTDESNFVGKQNFTRATRIELIQAIAKDNLLQMREHASNKVKASFANRISQLGIPHHDIKQQYGILKQQELEEYIKLTIKERTQMLLQRMAQGNYDLRGIPLAYIDFSSQEFQTYEKHFKDIIVGPSNFNQCTNQSTLATRGEIVKWLFLNFDTEIAITKIQEYRIPEEGIQDLIDALYEDRQLASLSDTNEKPLGEWQDISNTTNSRSLEAARENDPNAKTTATPKNQATKPVDPNKTVVTPKNQVNKQADPNKTVFTPRKGSISEDDSNKTKPLKRDSSAADKTVKTSPKRKPKVKRPNTFRRSTHRQDNQGIRLGALNFIPDHNQEEFSLNYEITPQKGIPSSKKTTKIERA